MTWLEPSLGRITIAEWAQAWLDSSHHLKPKTRRDYEGSLRREVLPHMGRAAVAGVDVLAVRSFVAALVEAGAGASTIRNAVKVVRLVLGTAVEAGAIRTNPAAQLRGLPRPGRSEALFLSPEQVETLAQAITPPYGTLVRFAAYTGLRAGEIGALRIGRLEMLRGAVHVVESVADVDGQLHLGPTKTYANRRVPMPPFLVDELACYLASRPSDPESAVFTAPDGGPLRHNNFYGRKYKPAVKRASLTPCGSMTSDIRTLPSASPRPQTRIS